DKDRMWLLKSKVNPSAFSMPFMACSMHEEKEQERTREALGRTGQETLQEARQHFGPPEAGGRKPDFADRKGTCRERLSRPSNVGARSAAGCSGQSQLSCRSRHFSLWKMRCSVN